MKHLQRCRSVFFFSLYFISIFFITGCLPNDVEKAALDQATAAPPEHESPVVQRPTPAPHCFDMKKNQPQAEITKNIDILFMVDTSGSLNEERAAIGDGVDAFVAALPSDASVRIGVMLAHAGEWSGRLYRYSNVGPFVLDTKTMSLSDIRKVLRERMVKVASESETDGGEVGIYSLSRALDVDRMAESKNLGFFREDAALAVVFVADENDICARYPAGIKPVYDGEKKEAPAFNKYCQNVTSENTYTKLRQYQGNRPLLVSGIIYFEGSNFPRTGENEIGYGYLEIIRANHGLMVDLAGGRYYEGLKQIGSLVTKKLNLVTEFHLEDKGKTIDETNIKVEVDGGPVPFTFDAAVSALHLTGYAGLENSEVFISYCLKETGNAETMPVLITKVKVAKVTSTTAEVTWTTDLFSSSQVEVVESLTGKKWMTLLDSHGVLQHVVNLSGLSSDKLYTIRVYSSIEGDPSVSGPVAFRTLR